MTQANTEAKEEATEVRVRRTPDVYDDIIELEEGARSTANEFLRQGYRLLFIGYTTNQVTSSVNQQVYIKRYATYTVGRPQGVKKFIPERRRKPQAGR